VERFADATIPFVCSDEGALAVRSWSARKIWKLFRYYTDFAGLIVRYRPHIVYSNTCANNIEVVIARALGPKTIVHVHEGESIVAQLRGRLMWSRPFTTRYVAVSQYVRTVLRKHLRVDSLVIYNGLSGPKYRVDHELRGKAADRILAVVGMLSENKGQLLAVEALALLRASGHDVTLRLIGSLEDVDYVAAVERRAVELEVDDYVDCVGQRSLEDLYADVDIVLIPSQEETFSLVALEAMAEGVLVVAANTGGLPEIVEDGKTGLLFRIGSATEMAQRVATALTHPARMADIVRFAQQRVGEKFSADKAAHAVTGVIMDTIGKRKTR